MLVGYSCGVLGQGAGGERHWGGYLVSRSFADMLYDATFIVRIYTILMWDEDWGLGGVRARPTAEASPHQPRFRIWSFENNL